MRRRLDWIPIYSVYRQIAGPEVLSAWLALMSAGTQSHLALTTLKAGMPAYLAWHITQMQNAMYQGQQIEVALNTGLFTKETLDDLRIFQRTGDFSAHGNDIAAADIDRAIDENRVSDKNAIVAYAANSRWGSSMDLYRYSQNSNGCTAPGILTKKEKIMQFTKLKRLIKTLCESLRRNREKGAITVMETLIALVIGTAVLSGVFAGIPALQDARRSTTGINGLMQIATSIRSTFGTRNNFTGLTTALATQLAGFPRNFMDGTNVRHPWGWHRRYRGGYGQLPAVHDHVQRC